MSKQQQKGSSSDLSSDEDDTRTTKKEHIDSFLDELMTPDPLEVLREMFDKFNAIMLGTKTKEQARALADLMKIIETHTLELGEGGKGRRSIAAAMRTRYQSPEYTPTAGPCVHEIPAGSRWIT